MIWTDYPWIKLAVKSLKGMAVTVQIQIYSALSVRFLISLVEGWQDYSRMCFSNLAKQSLFMFPFLSFLLFYHVAHSSLSHKIWRDARVIEKPASRNSCNPKGNQILFLPALFCRFSLFLYSGKSIISLPFFSNWEHKQPKTPLVCWPRGKDADKDKVAVIKPSRGWSRVAERISLQGPLTHTCTCKHTCTHTQRCPAVCNLQELL